MATDAPSPISPAADYSQHRRRKSKSRGKVASSSSRPAVSSSSKRHSSDKNDLRRQMSEHSTGDKSSARQDKFDMRRTKNLSSEERVSSGVKEGSSSSKRKSKPSSPKELQQRTSSPLSIKRKGSSAEKKASSGSESIVKRKSLDGKPKRRPSSCDLEILQFEKQERRSSKADSKRSKSLEKLGSRRLSDEEDNYKIETRARQNGGRQKKKPLGDSMLVVSDKGTGKDPDSLFAEFNPIPTNLFAANLEEFDDDAVQEKQPKRSFIDRTVSDKKGVASKRERSKSGGRPRKHSAEDASSLSQGSKQISNSEHQRRSSFEREPSLGSRGQKREIERSESSSGGKFAAAKPRPRRCTLSEWDNNPDYQTANESELDNKEGAKLEQLSSSLKRTTSSGERPRRKGTDTKRRPKRLSLDSSLILTSRTLLRRRNNSINDISASGNSSDGSSSDMEAKLQLSQTPRKQELVAGIVASERNPKTPNDSPTLPTTSRKASLELFEQSSECISRSDSVESSGKTKRRHKDKIKRKESSNHKLKRSNSFKLLSSDKRKAFAEKGTRRASIDGSFIRRKSGEFATLTRRSTGDFVGGATKEKKEERNTQAGEATSELEGLVQKNDSVTCKSSTKSSLSIDKQSSRSQSKKRKKRKWIAFGCCALFLMAILAVVIVFMLSRANYKAETAKTSSNTLTTPVAEVADQSSREQPSPSPIVIKTPMEPQLGDLAIIVIVQLDDKPEETGFSLISADNTTTWVYYPFGSLSGRQDDVITEVVNIPVHTEVVFTFTDTSGGVCCEDGNGYYRVFSGSGQEKRSLISGDSNSEYRFFVGNDTAIQTGGIDPNESCKPCPNGIECGRCAWCNADRGFLPDTIFSYQCHTTPISINEKCFIGAKRVILHNQYVAAMSKCTNGFEPWPQLQSTQESTLCVSEAKCIKKFSFVDPDCDSELSGSELVTESCQDVVGGSAFGYDYDFHAPRENECRPGPYSMADFAEALASRCCVDGVAFCSTFNENSTSATSYLTPSAASTDPEPTLQPTTSLRPSVSNGYQMTIVIMLDNFPKETGWTITSENSEITYMKRVPGYYRESSKLVVETVSIPLDSNAIFNITDEGGDGICCENGEGYFQIYTEDGSLVVDEGGSFEGLKSVNVFAGTPLTLSPTVSLSPSASPAPSQGLFPITIAVQFDQWASETGFSILSLDGTVLYEWAPGSFSEPNQHFNETVQLPYESEVIFNAIDSGDDGFCCLFGDGSITIFAGDNSADESAIIESKTAEFQSDLSFSFWVGPPPSSTPTVTSTPTFSNTNSVSGPPTTSSQLSALSSEVTVVLQFDKYSAETGWFIDSADGTKNYVARPLGYYEFEQSKKIVETISLPEGHSYRFRIIDLMGDGTCCWAGAGWYAMYDGRNINDNSTQIFYGDGEFGLEREHNFTVGTVQTNAPTISHAPTTSSPTTKPSISLHPTETMFIVDMTVKLDGDASQTGFFIAAVSDEAVYFDRPPGYYNGMNEETIEESIPLPAGQYHFALLDTGGDGFCCLNGFGFYSLYDHESGEVLVFSDGKFLDAKNETFTVGGVSDEKITQSGTNGLRGSLRRQRNHVG